MIIRAVFDLPSASDNEGPHHQKYQFPPLHKRAAMDRLRLQPALSQAVTHPVRIVRKHSALYSGSSNGGGRPNMRSKAIWAFRLTPVAGRGMGSDIGP